MPVSSITRSAVLATFALLTTILVADERDDLLKKLKVWHTPIEPAPEYDERAALGHQLFFDVRLSATGKTSCVDCHSLENYGTSKSLVREQLKEGTLHLDIPTVINASQLTLYTWKGKKMTFSERVTETINSEQEMGKGGWEARLKRLSPYAATFTRLYPDKGMTKETIADALTEYQKQLVAPAQIDKFLNQDKGALTDKQLKGFKLFIDKNCSACHTGPMFGGQMVQIIGTKTPWPNSPRKVVKKNELGIEVVTQPIYRVAPLRNVVKTAPYFHDANAKNLLDAIRKMARHEGGIPVDTQETILILSFLKTLTGELPEEWIASPKLPEER